MKQATKTLRISSKCHAALSKVAGPGKRQKIAVLVEEAIMNEVKRQQSKGK